MKSLANAVSAFLFVSLLTAGLVASAADEKPATNERALQAVQKHIASLFRGKELPPPVKAQLDNLVPIDDPVLAEALPNCRVFLLRFRMWPVAMAVPEPFKPNDLFAVTTTGDPEFLQVTMMTTPAELQVFCRKNLAATKADAARKAAHAYMILRKELAQDGFFRFEIDPAKFEVDEQPGRITVKAAATVVPGGGNAGSIQSTIVFTGDKGTFSVAQEQAQFKAGMRPICQSLKLTDPDPAVRAQAEHDLLIMGKNALPYLRMQAGKTAGELQRRIIDLTRRIEAGEGGPNLPGGQPPAN
jgi:hypothetical protein